MKKILPYLMLLMLVAATAEAVTAFRYSDNVANTRGDAIGGAYVTVYISGTTTKATLYVGPSSTMQAAQNPTRTDGYGRFYFYAEPGVYDITISGSGITTYTISEVRIFSDSGAAYNVLHYGASTESGNDDTSSIQAAVDAAGADGGGQVLLPPGMYHTTDAITVSSDDVAIVGSGIGATTMRPANADTGFSCIILDGVSRCLVTGLTIKNYLAPGATEVDGVQILGGDHNVIRACSIDSCDNAGVSVGYDWVAYFAQSTPEKMIPKASIDGGYHVISDNIITNSQDGYGVEIMRGDNIMVSNNIIENTESYAVRVVGAYDSIINSNIISGCHSGVAFQSYGDADIGVTKFTDRSIATGNIIKADFGLQAAHGVTNSSFIGNNIECTLDSLGVGIEIAYSAGAVALNNSNAIGNITVKDNDVTGGAISILVDAPGYGYDIRGNLMSNFDWMGFYSTSGTSSDTLRSVVIEANTIRPGWKTALRGTKYGFYIDGLLVSGYERMNTFDTFGYSGTWVERYGTSNLVKDRAPVFSTTAPDTVGWRGRQWFDRVNSKLKVYTGSAWVDLH